MPASDFHRFFPRYLDTNTQLLLSKTDSKQQELNATLALMRNEIDQQLDNILNIATDNKKYLQWQSNQENVEKTYKLLTKVRHFLQTRQHSDDINIVSMRSVLQQFDILITTHYTTISKYRNKLKTISAYHTQSIYEEKSENIFDTYYQKCYKQPTPCNRYDLDPLTDEILDSLETIERLTQNNAEIFKLLMINHSDARQKLAFTNQALHVINTWSNNPNKYVKNLYTTICTYQEYLEEYKEQYRKHDPEMPTMYKRSYQQAMEKRQRRNKSKARNKTL